ncbi:MAG: UDP-glucose 4-epimerase GalE [bacterium]|nr:UDP-glucose 4-epimerase GalE [bacterium]
MSDEKVLVVGGAGYIGSHTNKILNKAGYQTIVLDNLSYGHRDFVKWGELIEGDMADEDLLDDIFTKNKIKAVMHFSAFIAVGESVQKPGIYYDNNVSKTVTLLNKMIQHNVPYFIFSSTCAIMGEPQYLPLDEKHPRNPINPYGWSKYMVEQILHDFEQAHGLKSTVLRYFNASGADPDAQVGEKHDPETHLIPLILDAAMGVRENITIFGDDYETRDGTCIRDYIHVNDLAEAHLLALNWMVENQQCNHFNLGNGEGFTVKEIIEVVEKVTGKSVPIKMGMRREGDAASLVGSSEKAQKVLGWVPKLNSIEDIVSTAWNWHQRMRLM